MGSNKKELRIKSLNSWRFVFFVCIFLSHYMINGVRVLPVGGPLGVSFFFILSGFSLCIGYADRLDNLDYLFYIKRRILRLYPMHLLTLSIRIVTFLLIPLLAHQEVGGKMIALVANILMIQAWIPVENIVFSYNTVAWFLSPVFFFYVLFPVLCKSIMKTSLERLFFLYLIVIGVYFVLIHFVPVGGEQLYLYVAPYARIIDFSIGITLFRITRMAVVNRWIAEHASVIAKFSLCFELIYSLIIVAIVVLWNFVELVYGVALIFWIPLSVIIFCSVLVERVGGGKFLLSQNLQQLGNASFEMYMIHAIIISFFNHAGGIFISDNLFMMIIRMMVCLAITICMGLFLQKYFCSPIARKLNELVA